MDKWAKNFDWNRARAFLATAQEGSLSAAARVLGMAQPTLGRQVSALEEELGVVLFERAGRGLILTPSGMELLEHVRTMGEAATAVSLIALGQSQSLEGSVCISATDICAALQLPPIIAKLQRLEPGIHIEIISENSSSNLRKREADIAIRNFRPVEPDLIARKIGEELGWLYASHEYLAGICNAQSHADLSRAVFIDIDRGGAWRDYLIGLKLGLTEKNFSILSENHMVMWEMVKSGAGIGPCGHIVGDAEPKVRAVPGIDPIPFPVWLVVHREVNTSRRVRRVFDFLAEALAC